MSIASIADYKNALKERPIFFKTAARNGAFPQWFTLWDGTGTPGAGTLAVGNTANGVVPTDATTGAPTINFGSGLGYLTEVEFNTSQAGRFALYDRLFHAGAYAFNAAVTLASQPSFSSRVPGGTDFTGLQLWVECVTTFTGSLSLAVTYTNQSGVAAHSTGTIVVGALTVGQMLQLPLQSGDSGIQKIESVTATIATVGTFNVLVTRPLWSARSGVVTQRRYWLDRLGMPQVWGDSCLAAMTMLDGAVTPIAEFFIEIASK
jgi:hypothetical protein